MAEPRHEMQAVSGTRNSSNQLVKIVENPQTLNVKKTLYNVLESMRMKPLCIHISMREKKVPLYIRCTYVKN